MNKLSSNYKLDNLALKIAILIVALITFVNKDISQLAIGFLIIYNGLSIIFSIYWNE